MKRSGLLLGANLVLSVMALVASTGAIALHFMDPREPDAAGAPTPAEPTPAEAPPEPSPALDLGDGPARTADVTARALPSVVNISTTRMVEDPTAGNPFFDVFRQFFGLGEAQPHEAQSLGSGVIVSEEGVVLTNHHVVADSSEIRVVLSDGREYPARIVGSDPESDVAVLRLQGEDIELPALSYGDSSRLRQGEIVLAIGNPFGVGQTVTMGIVSATGRASMGITDYEDFIQTDAAINPGNSGGALVNLRGELVGINTAILSRTGGNHGIGFAIPSNMARPIAEALLRDGRVTRGWLGASLADLGPELARSMGVTTTNGVVVMDVLPDGPAARVDLRRGDLITRLDSEPIRSSRQFRNLVATRGAGTTVRITRVRSGQSAEVSLTLIERPRAQLGTPGTPPEGPDLTTAGATDVGGLLVQPLTDALRSQLGVPSDVRQGAVIVGTREGSAGASAGVTPGDIVVEINGQPVTSPAQLAEQYESSVFVAMLGVRRGVDTRLVILRR